MEVAVSTSHPLDQQLAALTAELTSIDWDVLSGERSLELLGEMQRAINILELVKSRGALRVEQTNQHKALRLSASSFLANAIDITKASAKKSLKLANQLQSLPEVDAVAATGSLNLSKASEIADAATACPDAVGELLEVGAQETTADVLLFADKVRARKATKKKREDAIKNRGLSWTRHDELSSKMTMVVPNEMRAEINSAVEPVSKMIHEESRSRGGAIEPAAAYDADALVMLARLYWVNRRRAKNKQLSAAELVKRPIRVGITAVISGPAFERGYVIGGEVCEIKGAGPVALQGIIEKLHDPMLRVVTVGDARAVSVPGGKYISEAVRGAVATRDKCCVIKGCGKKYGLELDHNQERRDSGGNHASNLNWLCKAHHQQKTVQHLKLIGERGQMELVPLNFVDPAEAVQERLQNLRARLVARSDAEDVA